MRRVTPRGVYSLEIIERPYKVEGKSKLLLVYRTPTGKHREMQIDVNVRDVLCINSTIKKLKADYKQLAQELANTL